jgi:hypothetical protein
VPKGDKTVTDLPESSAPEGQPDQALPFPSLPSPAALHRRREARRRRAIGLALLLPVLGVGLLTLGLWAWRLAGLRARPRPV